jgi:hypothetical protein
MDSARIKSPAPVFFLRPGFGSLTRHAVVLISWSQKETARPQTQKRPAWALETSGSKFHFAFNRF